MAKQDFKDLATELTAPRGSKPFVIPLLLARMKYSTGNDPVKVKSEFDNNPDIDPSELLMCSAGKLLDKYATDADIKQEQRVINGGPTDFEQYQATTIAVRSIYEHTTSPAISFTQSLSAVPPGHSLGMPLIGKDGVNYTPVYDENGNIAYYNTRSTCSDAKKALAASMTLPNDNLIDKSQMDQITYKYDPKTGNMVERTAEDMQFQLAMARVDNQYTKMPYQLDMIERITADVARQNTPAANSSIMFKSAAPAAIATNVAPGAPFAEAVSGANAPAATTIPLSPATPDPSKSIMFQNLPPKPKAPWEQKASANERSFELSA